MSGEQFQQLSPSYPLLSLDRFHLKQTPVLNFNYRDSLGFSSYILHKKTFFSAWFAFSSVASLNFPLPKWLALRFQMFASFFFSLPKWLAFHDEKRFASLFFFVVWWASLGPGVNYYFLGFWEYPKMKFSSKSRPCFINLGLS